MELGKDLAGRRLGGRYLLDREIEAGGMASVWKARDDVLGRDVAVKILHPDLGSDEEMYARFTREAVAAARLSHPAIVRVFDTGTDDGVCYIVMELVRGRTLADEIAEGPFEPARAAAVARGVLDALAHAHAAGVVHRDVKPQNILLDEGGSVKVTDFGIAKTAFTGGDLTMTGRLLGTARYLAPEQVSDGEIDGRADLYAIGVVLYEMLTGRVPFDAETELATATLRLTADPRPPGDLRAGIPRELDAIVMRALEREPDDRFASAEEMSATLHGFAAPLDDRVRRTATHTDPAPAESGSFFRSWMLVPFALLLVALVVVGGGLLMGRLEVGGPLGVRLPEEGGSGSARLRPLPIEAVRDHDPGGDGVEHPERVEHAIDGARGTAWETERYDSANLGGLKSGVGIILDLGAPRTIRQVTLRTTVPGWRFEIQGSDDGGAFSDALPAEDGGTRFTARRRTELALRPAEYRYLLVWVTELAQADDGYRAAIAEVEVLG